MALMMAAVGAANQSAVTGDAGKAKPATESLFRLVDRKSNIDSASPDGAQPGGCAGRVQLQGVSFSYPSRPGVLILRSFSLDIPAGQMAALVGESGSGKSTVVQLCLRFYDPDTGAVLLDGTDMRDLNLKWLRTQVRAPS